MRISVQNLSKFKEEIKKPGRRIDSIITYGNNEKLYASDLKNVKPILNAELLKSVMKGLYFDSYVEIEVGTQLNYQFGLYIPSDEEFMYIDYGNYIINSKELNEDTGIWSYKCYDKMVNAMVDYTSLPDGFFPATVRDYINALAQRLGLTFKNANDEFVNYDKIVNEDHYLDSEGNSLGYSFRDIFDELSSVVAGNLVINNDDELEIKYLTETNDTIDEHYLKDVNVKFGKKVGPINTLYLARAEKSDVIYRPTTLPENIVPITIAENQIMNGNDRDQFIDGIYNQLNGLEYYINDYISTGILYYEFGDIYNVEIGNNSYKCIMMNDEPTIQGGVVENIFTDEIEESEIDYEKADNTDRRIAQTILYVDKKNREIVERVEDAEGNITELKTTVDGLELDLTRSGNNILMGTALYDKTYWGERLRYYMSSPIPPDISELGPTEYVYWYCTQTNNGYENGIIYQGHNQTWTQTDLMRKDLEETVQDAEILDTKWTSENFLSQKAFRLGYTETQDYLITKSKKKVVFSSKIKNEVQNGIARFVFRQYSGEPNTGTGTFLYGELLDIEKGEMTELSEMSYVLDIGENTDYINIAISVVLDEGETVQNGDFIIGDIKLEYGTNATEWTNNMNEANGLNYKMDGKGFEIKKGDYILHLDEDEITGSYNNEIQFQLNKYNTYSKNGKFKTTDQDGLITQKLTNGMYVRYIK